MIPYIEEMEKCSTKQNYTVKTSATSASGHLFNTREDKMDLKETQTKIYHNFVSRSTFSANRSRTDIHTKIAFLSMRVKYPDKDDWKKLVCMMSYLCGMTDLPLMLCTDRTNIYKWWVDGSHGVNTNFRGHTGASQSQEKFPIISAPTK